jgi:hypothetical protein
VGRDEADDADDVPKGFIEEVFEHRQRRPEPITPPDEAPGTVGDDDATLEPAESSRPAVSGAGDDPLHPGLTPDPGPAGGAGVGPEELGEPVMAPRQPELEQAAELGGDERAILDEAMKKSGIVWIDSEVAGRPSPRAAWYVWLDGAAYVLTGAGEQPAGALDEAPSVRVSARSKETRSLLVQWVGTPARLTSQDPDWEQVATALAKARLNLPEPAAAPRRWAADPAVAIYRITPTAPLLEAPGRYFDSARRAVPVPSPAVTAGPAPKVVHRRQTARRALS